MSFSFTLLCKPEGINAALEMIPSYGEPAVCDAAKDAVRKIAAKAPPDVLLQVEASGHMDNKASSSASHHQIGNLELKVKIFREPLKAMSA
jgi:hypothetical protein